MALITRSIEMSFSASRLRRTVTSMSIGSLLVRTAGGLTESVEAAGACRLAGIVLGRQAAELHLHPAWSERAVAHLALRTVDLQHDALLIGVDHSCLMLNGTSGHVPLRIMILIGERPVDTRRGHLERVGRVAHRVPRVEPGRQLAADLGDVIEADSAVGVHHDAQHPAAPGGDDLDALQVHVDRLQHGLDQAGNSRRVRRAWSAAAVARTWPAAVMTGPPAARAAAAAGRTATARVTPGTATADGPCLTRGAATGVLAHHASSPTTWTCLPGSSLAGTAARRSDLLLFAA